ATVQGIGASLSGLVAGEIVDHFGYSSAFLALAAAAAAALTVFGPKQPTGRRYRCRPKSVAGIPDPSPGHQNQALSALTPAEYAVTADPARLNAAGRWC
ncbi:MAG TPA: hypothetical protein VN849_03975, partial [Stellaceae bacterium]|nr:hypothetical protein [Stellaceae bacterium]